MPRVQQDPELAEVLDSAQKQRDIDGLAVRLADTIGRAPTFDIAAPEFGADPSRSRADNTTRIQAAIDAAAAVGGTVWIPPASSAFQANALHWRDGVNGLGSHGPYAGGSVLDAFNYFGDAAGVEQDFYGHAVFSGLKFTNTGASGGDNCWYISKQIGNVDYIGCQFGGYRAGKAAFLIDRTGASAGTVERLSFHNTIWDDVDYGFYMDGGTTTAQHLDKCAFTGVTQFNNFRTSAFFVRTLYVATLVLGDIVVFEGNVTGGKWSIQIQAESTGVELGSIFEENTGIAANGGTAYYPIDIQGINHTVGGFHNPLTGTWRGGNISAYQGASRHADCVGAYRIAGHNQGFRATALFVNNPGTPVTGERVWLPASNVNETFRHLVGGAGEPAFQNGHGNLGGTAEPVCFYVDGNGEIVIRGYWANAGVATGLVIFTLPAGFRPATDRRFPVNHHDGANFRPGQATILQNGNVRLDFTGGAPNITTGMLDGIRFRIN